MKQITFEQLPQAVSKLFDELETIKQLIIADRATNASEAEDLLTIQQASEFLRLSVPTLYGYVSKSVIPVCKRPGSKRLWFSKQELTDWIKAGRKQTAEEVKAQVEYILTSKSKKK